MKKKTKAELEAERQLKRDIEQLHREASQALDRAVGPRAEPLYREPKEKQK